MRVLVLTVVHTPLDARIHHRQIGAMLAAGWQVRYAAPWRATGTAPPTGLETVDVPRAQGRRRLRSLLAAVRLLRRTTDVDLVLVHDPELLLAVAAARPRVPVVWDVHEDAVASLVDRPWLPAVLRRLAGASLRRVERWAERRTTLLLAEEAYADRFTRSHALVRNVPVVPDERPAGPPADRVIYVGRVSRFRGAEELIELGRLLRDDAITVEVVGAADADVRESLQRAAAAGDLVWRDFLPNREALARVDGSLAGLALLHDVPNYRVSLPTKVVEYLSRGVPVVTTPLPVAREIVESHEVGRVVGFGDVAAAAEAVRWLHRHPAERERMAERGWRTARDRFDWADEGERFLDVLREAARSGTRR